MTTLTARRRSNATRKLGLAAAALAIAGAGLVTNPGQAHASGAWINGWNTRSAPVRCTLGSQDAVYFCLYYSQGANGGIWMEDHWSGESSFYGDYFRNDGWGSSGAGQGVRRNAASVENSSSWTLAVYSGAQFSGDVNWVPAGRGGNLTWNLRNKNESANFL